jgi:hypothetical protein
MKTFFHDCDEFGPHRLLQLIHALTAVEDKLSKIPKSPPRLKANNLSDPVLGAVRVVQMNIDHFLSQQHLGC